MKKIFESFKEINEKKKLPKVGDTIKVEGKFPGIWVSAKVTGVKNNMIQYETRDGDFGNKKLTNIEVKENENMVTYYMSFSAAKHFKKEIKKNNISSDDYELSGREDNVFTFDPSNSKLMMALRMTMERHGSKSVHRITESEVNESGTLNEQDLIAGDTLVDDNGREWEVRSVERKKIVLRDKDKDKEKTISWKEFEKNFDIVPESEVNESGMKDFNINRDNIDDVLKKLAKENPKVKAIFRKQSPREYELMVRELIRGLDKDSHPEDVEQNIIVHYS